MQINEGDPFSEKYEMMKSLYDDMRVEYRDSLTKTSQFLYYIDIYSKMKYQLETSTSIGENVELLDIVSTESAIASREYNIMKDEITIIREMA